MTHWKRANEACSSLPWCNDNPKELGEVISNFVQQQDAYKTAWAQKWFENFQFVYGNQNLRWSRKYGVAVDVDFMTRKNPSVNQRSQTNITRMIFEALANALYGSPPSWDVTAADESSTQGKRFQNVCKKLLSCHQDALELTRDYRQLAGILTGYGCAAAWIDYDPTSGRVLRVPQYREEEIPVTTTQMIENSPFGLIEVPVQARNSQGQPMFEKRMVPVRDQNGEQVYKHTWAGNARVTALTPFEYALDASQGVHKTTWVQRYRLMDFDKYLKEYGQVAGRTAHWDKVKPGNVTNYMYQFAMKQFMRMAFVAPVDLQEFKARSIHAMRMDFLKHKVMVVEHFDAPDPEKWPNGRRVIVTNGFCTHITEPQYHTNKIDGWHPAVFGEWLRLAPANMSTGPINDVVSKNREINIQESLIDTSVLRNMGSMLLVKSGQGLDPQRIFGEPGQIFEVNDPQSVARWLRDDQPIPPVMMQLQESKMEKAYELSGAQDALRGERSKGASSGYMLKQLEEREQKRITPAREELEKLVSGIGEKLLACIKQNVQSLDENVWGYLQRNAAGEFSLQDVVAFLQTPIDYGVEVRVTPNSMASKSKASEQATTMEVVTKTSAGQRLNDPKVLDSFLKFMEIDVLRDSSAKHRDRAQRENEVFSDIGRLGPNATGVSLPVVMFEDDDDIHLQEHQDDLIARADQLQGNEFELFCRTLHMETHRAQKKEKAGQIPVGASANLPQMMSAARGREQATLGEVAQKKQMQDQAKQQQAQQPQPQPQQGPNGAPQAPKLPAGRTDPGAPAQNTPAGRQNAPQPMGGP